MKRTVGLVAGTVVVAALGFGAGAWVIGNAAMGFVLDNTVNRDARDIRTLVGALTDLRTGNAVRAGETIEALMNDHIIVLAPAEPYPGISAATEAEVEAALRAAHEFRQAYPRSEPLPTDAMVDGVLEMQGIR